MTSAPLRVRATGPGAAAPALGLLVVAVVVCLLSALAQGHEQHGTDGPALLGLAVRVVATTSAAGVVGCLLICLCRPRRSGPPELDLVGAASGWALVWLAALLAGFALELVDPFSAAGAAVGPDVGAATARWRWLVVGVVLAALVRLLCAAARTRADVGLVLTVALAGVVVATGTGHAGAVLSPDSVPLLAHVLAATAWIGGLLALALHAPVQARGPALAPTVRAYSRLAAGCYVLLLASGVLGLLSHTGVGELLGSGGYLWIVVAKLSLLVLLGLAGALQRRDGLAQLEAGDSHLLLRISVVELILMAAALGLGVTLAHSAA